MFLVSIKKKSRYIAILRYIFLRNEELVGTMAKSRFYCTILLQLALLYRKK